MSLPHALDALLPLAHCSSLLCASSQRVLAAPLTLVEETSTCAADFILLHALTRAARDADGAALSAAAAASAAVQSLKPAIVLCAFKNSVQHYTHIARKWGVPLPPLQAAGVLYLIDDLTTGDAAPVSASAVPSSDNAASAESALDAKLDAWFRTAPASAATPSPLQQFVARMHELRARHSSLLLIVDDLQWLMLHSGGGEMEVLDAIVSLQVYFAAADAAADAAKSADKTPAAAASAVASFIAPGAASPPATAASALPSGLLLAVQGDAPVSPVRSLLRRHASTFVQLQPLQTGYTKEISGVMSVQQQDVSSGVWSAIERAHYKLAETSVKVSAPGHSSSTLQQ